MRQDLSDAYSKKDNRAAYTALGKGLYRVEIPISKELLSQIRTVKEANQQAAQPRDIKQAVAEKNGYDQSSLTRAKVENSFPNTNTVPELFGVPVPPLAPTPVPKNATPAEREFYREIDLFKAEAMNFSYRGVQMADVRVDYMKTIKLASDEFVELVNGGKITPKEGALRANKLRNVAMNINKILDGVTNLLSFGNDDKPTKANTQTQTFVPQTAVDGWLANLYRQTETNKTAPFAFNTQQQTQQQVSEPTAAELAYFVRLSNAEKGKEKDAKPRLPESLLSEANAKAAVDNHLRRTVERYYYFIKDIGNQTVPIAGNKNSPQPKTEQQINQLKTERDALSKPWTDDFQKIYDKASKEVEKDAKKTPMTADEMRAKTTEVAVQRWNSKVLFDKTEVEENTKADKGLTLFVKGKDDVRDVELNDVTQGQVGDCFILVGIGAIAKQNPENVRDIIKDKGNGNYEVRLYNQRLDGSFEETSVPVNGKLIGEGHAKYGDAAKVEGKEQKEAWTVLIEKAYIQGNVGSYKNANKGGSARQVMTALTGREAETKINANLSADEFSKLLKSNRAIVFSTPDKASEITNGKMRGKFEGYKLVENHAYVLQEVKTNDKGKEVAVLYNPWGTQHAEVPLDEAKELFKYVTAEGANAK